MKRVFISRHLSPTSVFHSLDSKSWKVLDKSLVKINCIDFNEKKETSWIFFYSKNGIRCYFDKRSFSESIKYAVMGEGTAKSFKDRFGAMPHFIGSGDPEQTAHEFEKKCSSESVLFVKAQSSRNSIYTLLPENIEKHTVDVYNNQPLESFELESCDCLIFTSPLNAQAYFSKYPYREELVLSIGKTTSNYLMAEHGITSSTPDETNEKALFELLVKTMKI